ncbi:MAG: hypothetical protein J6Y77_05870, partial [Paludibacteraceae bacterium]|nr:hypothetical protein [Paludibacteraceae bacterium]
NATRVAPDIQVVKGSYFQNVSFVTIGLQTVVTVTAENGDQLGYTLQFVPSKSNDATLKSLSMAGVGLNFDPAQTDYDVALAAETTLLPKISFEKQSDGQTVVLTEGGVNGLTTLTVTAEDGAATRTYTIQSSVAAIATSEAVLADLFVVGGESLNYAADVYEYRHPRAVGQALYGAYNGLCAEDERSAFVAADSLVITLNNAVSSQTKSYTLVFDDQASSNALLADLRVNGASHPLFNPNVDEYEYAIIAGETLDVEPVAAEVGQTLTLAYDETTAVYTITVTAADGLTTKNYSLAVLNDLSSNALLADIQIDGVSIEGFAADRFSYSLTVPSATPKLTQPVLPDLKALGAARGQQITVDYKGFGEPTYITVTAENGVDENVYEINLLAQKSSNALLDDLAADYVTLTDFESDKFDYVLDVAGNYRPTISWQRGDAFQTVTDEVSDSQVVLTVEAEDGLTTNVYTIAFNAVYSSDVTIEGILLDGSMLSGFDVNTHQYEVVLPFGTEVLPDITVVSGADGQSVVVTDQGLNGTATIVITAEDGQTSQSYEILFSVEPSNIAWLQEIACEGAWIPEFSSLTTDYEIELPVGTLSRPAVTFVKGDLTQTVDTLADTADQFVLHVLAENGVDEMTYTLSFTYLKSHNASLSDILVNGSSLSGFDPARFDYTVEVPVGVKTLPEIEAIAGDQWQTISYDTVAAGKDSVVTIRVLADDQQTVNEYHLTCVFLLSENALLQEITLDGNLLGGFAPTTFEYTCMLPIGTTELPVIDYVAGDEWQTVTVNDQTAGAEGVYNIHVQSESGAENNYNLIFVVEKSHNKTLGGLYVNNGEIELVEDQFDYQVVLPYGTTEVTVTAVPDEEDQTVTPETQTLGVTETAVIVVTAADGTDRTYTVTFSNEKSHESQLQMIYYDGTAVADFDPTDEGPYEILLPFGTQAEPAISYDSMKDIFGEDCPYESVVIDLLSTTYDEHGAIATFNYELTVVAQDGIEVSSYALYFEVEKSSENRLRDLTVFGQTVTDFDPETLSYLLQYEPYTDPATLPHTAADFGWQLVDPNLSTAVLDIKTDENGDPIGVFNVKVTADNGQVRIYTVRTEVRLSDNTKLNNITVNGNAFKDFDPEKREYIYIVPFGTKVLDSTYVVEWELQEIAQTVETTTIGLTYTIWVEAQDGSFDSYVIQFVPSDYDPTQEPTEDNVCVSAQGDGSWKFTTDTRNVMLVLTDLSGRILLTTDLDLVDPNIDDICSRQANGFVYNGPSGQVVVYYFMHNKKKIISSGKFRTGY